MCRVRNVMISAVKSENVVNASRYALMLFPNAAFHVVTVVRKLKSRHFYTGLYSDIAERIAEDAVNDVELALLGGNCLAVRKVILHGDPAKELLRYARSNNIDLIVITSSISPTPPPEPVGSVASRVTSGADVPVLVYTPLSNKLLDQIMQKPHTVLLAALDISHIETALPLATSIARVHGADINIITMKRPGSNVLEYVRRHLTELNVRFEITTVAVGSTEDYVSKVLEESYHANVLVVKRLAGVLGRSVLKLVSRRRLSAFERSFMGLSPIPVIIA